jgi:hypothetical protein
VFIFVAVLVVAYNSENKIEVLGKNDRLLSFDMKWTA